MREDSTNNSYVRNRLTCALLLQHPLFMQDCFAEKFMAELREHVAKEAEENPLLQIRRDEDRRASVISLDEPVRAYTSSTRSNLFFISKSYGEIFY